MEGFLTALRAELFIATRSNSSRVTVLLPTLIVIAQLAATRLREVGEQARDALLNGSGFGSSGPVTNAYGYFVDGLGTGLTILILMLVALAAYSFAYDRDTGLIRHLLIRRISRSALVLAKLAQLHIVALLSLLLLLISTWLCSGLLWDFGAIVEDGFELIGEAEIQTEILLGMKLAVLPIPAMIAFGLLVSVVTQSTTQAVTTALGITLAMDIFKSTLGDYSHYLFASFQPSLIDQSYLQEVSRIVRGFSDVLIDERVLLLNTWVPLPQMLLLAAISLVLVQRRSV
ncbi:MAG: ABC transporter permease subunit [Gammaproteobacteria bacterium]|nr:ABC transporter permease subunit [Gammaproteobacteria bacterium]